MVVLADITRRLCAGLLCQVCEVVHPAFIRGAVLALDFLFLCFKKYDSTGPLLRKPTEEIEADLSGSDDKLGLRNLARSNVCAILLGVSGSGDTLVDRNARNMICPAPEMMIFVLVYHPTSAATLLYVEFNVTTF